MLRPSMTETEYTQNELEDAYKCVIQCSEVIMHWVFTNNLSLTLNDRMDLDKCIRFIQRVEDSLKTEVRHGSN